jgi:hypothetical protein
MPPSPTLSLILCFVALPYHAGFGVPNRLLTCTRNAASRGFLRSCKVKARYNTVFNCETSPEVCANSARHRCIVGKRENHLVGQCQS